MVIIFRGPGALRLHVRNLISGRSLCGRGLDEARPRITRTAGTVTCVMCQTTLARALTAMTEVHDVVGAELFEQIVEEATGDGS